MKDSLSLTGKKLFVSAKWHNKNAINASDRKEDKGWKADAFGAKWERMNWFVRPGRYLIDYRNNERQFPRHEEPSAVHSAPGRPRRAINTVACAFFCYRKPASWMNARWTSESKPSWPHFYWSCRCWHRYVTWYSRSVSDAPLQHPLGGKNALRKSEHVVQLESFSENLRRYRVSSTRVDNQLTR